MTARTKFSPMDYLRFRVEGAGAEALLQTALNRQLHLRHIRREPQGWQASAFGAALWQLQKDCSERDCRIILLRWQGPGRWAQPLLRRPGVAVGAVLFAVLLHLLPQMIWRVDFGSMTEEQQRNFRELLVQHELYEGSMLSQDELERLQREVSGQSEEYGWVSINFVGGCLHVESTQREKQRIQPEPQAAGLYAKGDGEILAVELTSGFAEVAPGQFVAAGQKVASAVREDRNGRPVQQMAEGKILAKMEQSYSAVQPYTETVTRLTGNSRREKTLYLMGRRVVLDKSEEVGDFSRYERRCEWEPLCVGKIALPGCLCVAVDWQQQEETQIFSPDTALQLAIRQCRAQLSRDFPDAVVQTEVRTFYQEEELCRCTVRYGFTANIAQNR